MEESLCRNERGKFCDTYLVCRTQDKDLSHEELHSLNKVFIAETYVLSAAIRSTGSHKDKFLEELNRIKNLPKHKLEHLIAIIATYQPDDDTVVVISENWLPYKTLN